MKDNKLKKVFDKYKIINAFKQPKKFFSLLSKLKIQNCISERYGYTLHAMNVKIPAVICTDPIYGNVQVS